MPSSPMQHNVRLSACTEPSLLLEQQAKNSLLHRELVALATQLLDYTPPDQPAVHSKDQ